MWFIGNLILFIALSPGILLTLPSLSPLEATKRGLSFGPDGEAQSCVSLGEWVSNSTCDVYRSVWTSKQTSNMSILVHSLLLYVILRFLFHSKGPIKSSVLFVLLSPGFLLTLPPYNS